MAGRIRKVTDKDFEIISRWFYNPVVFFLCDPELVYPFHKNDWIEFAKKRQFFVYCDDKRMIACVALKNGDDGTEITHLFVDKLFRRKSFAKHLIRHICAMSHKTAVKLHQSQREQIKLFETLGFENTKVNDEFLFESKNERFYVYQRSQD
ncbi:MAG: GNAT family N-acetyltransferase [Calditrichaeota bacterium]|nr:GNAT family N-acetyltransferase [Calditrichota bacterium]